MGKNVHGGAGHKKFARKYSTEQTSARNQHLRVASSEGELYAIVTKMCGNNMFHCFCSDNVVRLGYIRGKFTGRKKRDNLVECGKWVMVGLNEWNSSSGKNKMQKCELLEVYSDTEKSQLREIVKSVNWASFDANNVDNMDVSTNKAFDDGICFETEEDAQRRLLEEQIMDSSIEKIQLPSTNDDSNTYDFVNIDDI